MLIRKENFYVTEKDIDEGITYSSRSCPVALAIKRKFKSHAVSVLSSNCSIGNNHFRLPSKVRVFIENFDGNTRSSRFVSLYYSTGA